MVDSEDKRKEVTQTYAGSADAELERLASEAWTLTATGRKVLQAELTRRGLEVKLSDAPNPSPSALDLITLRRFRDMPEALLAKGALESAGIESFLIDETTIRMDWLWSNALGGIKLCVRPEDVEAAVQLLGQEIPEKFDVEGVGDFEQPKCPRCQSVDISFEDLNKRIAYGGILVGLPMPIKDGRWKCQACAYEWRPTDESKQGIIGSASHVSAKTPASLALPL